ncbi:hypothetical protein DKP76_13090 [Falsochrobactrum shanghaiense]|uniref:Uncharacterized protein n=1 Tax=Falsochrobactrum shanghaiense TaxID=2201899 RepID=A0A316J864_9HYPH|nr:hypothetical protein DKP76_13090 [Falsochrobactrum shanghaiense]
MGDALSSMFRDSSAAIRIISIAWEDVNQESDIAVTHSIFMLLRSYFRKATAINAFIAFQKQGGGPSI